jgi:hypothetical protein
MLAAWEAMRNWASGGSQPTVPTIQTLCELVDLSGLADGPCRFDSDFSLPSWQARVLPRPGDPPFPPLDNCMASHDTLCLTGDRFRVTANWRKPGGQSGPGHSVGLTGDTGYFWFFNEQNVEVVIKVLDACQAFGRFWVFAAGLTNVEVEIVVTDLATGDSRIYTNPQGTAFQPIQDTVAFASCP